jgi:hypothetical protein
MILSGCVASSSGIYIADQFSEPFPRWKNLLLIFSVVLKRDIFAVNETQPLNRLHLARSPFCDPA